MSARVVLCFGDSNTHGTMAMRWRGDRRRLSKPERWTSVMGTALGAGWEVLPEGHPGRTTVLDDPIEGAHKNSLRALPAILESHRPLDLVIVMLGTNDLKARFGHSAQDIALGVQRVLTEIRRSDCGPGGRAPEILIAAPVAALVTGIFTDMFAGATEKAAALPALLRGVAEQSGAAFVDLNEVAKVDPVDGIHLDATAHAAIGHRMAEAVRKALL
jgi:lysophospholipase L1-like esterase